MEGPGFAEQQAELSLTDYVAILKRHWVLASLAFLICAIGAGAAAYLQAERYESTATVIVRTSVSQSLFVAVPGNGVVSRDLQSELSLVESGEYQPAVAGDVRLSASSPENSSELRLRVESPSAAVSEDIAGQWAQSYIDGRRDFDIASVTATISSAEQSLAEVQALEAELLEPLQPIEDALETATDPDVISRLTTQRLSLLQSLDADLFPLRSQRQSLSSELGRQRITLQFLEDTPELGARFVAVSPGDDLRSPLVRNLVLGAVVGAILAAAVALLAENTRRRVHSLADLQSLVPDVPVLGELPETNSKHLAGPVSWVELSSDPAYRAGLDRLVTSLQLVAQQQGLDSVLVTSADAGSGKSSVASSLALTLANEGQPVALVDCDLRRPRLHSLFGVPQQPGLSDVLRNTADTGQSFHLLADEGGGLLGVIPSGNSVESPAELLRSEDLGKLVQNLVEQPAMVILDSPPLLPVTDASLIASAVDLAILVCRAGETTPDDLRAAVETLRRTNVTTAVLLVGSSNKSAYY